MNNRYHCLGCQCNLQNSKVYNSPRIVENDFFERDKRICDKCGVKDEKVFMNEFSDGTIVCKYGCAR